MKDFSQSFKGLAFDFSYAGSFLAPLLALLLLSFFSLKTIEPREALSRDSLLWCYKTLRFRGSYNKTFQIPTTLKWKKVEIHGLVSPSMNGHD
jgi:hypothetical protein